MRNRVQQGIYLHVDLGAASMKPVASRSRSYVHGYSREERDRLGDQASILAELLHHDGLFPAGSRVLEVGCGVGAQTVTLARLNPKARFTSIDVSTESVARARHTVEAQGLTNVQFEVRDVYELKDRSERFDHVFVCFVLEHLADPMSALRVLRNLLVPGGSITAIEGDHGSAYFHPPSAAADHVIQCLVELQARAGGDSLIGRRLGPLLRAAGFQEVAVDPRVVYADAGRPMWQTEFTRKTFIAMVEGVRREAVKAGLISAADWRKGVRDLERTAGPDGTFNYTFFKARGRRGP